MFAIRNHLEVSRIGVSKEDIICFGPLVELDLFLPKEFDQAITCGLQL
jgi:hypothetical protein